MEHQYYLALWAKGALSDQELEALEGEAALKEYKTILALTNKMHLPLPESLAWETFAKKRKPKNDGKLISFSWRYALAASLILLIGLGAFFSIPNSVEAQNDYMWVALPDESKAYLAPGATLTYPKTYGWFERHIEMTGEVRFEVSKGSPFKVVAPQGWVEVLGTVFRVIDQDDFFAVSCTEGKVGVHFDDKAYVIEKGMTINNKDQKRSVFSNAFLQNENFLYYNRVPLHYVVSVVEKNYSVQIDYERAKPFFFTGLIPLKNKEEALNAITAPFAIDYEIKTNQEIIFNPQQ